MKNERRRRSKPETKKKLEKTKKPEKKKEQVKKKKAEKKKEQVKKKKAEEKKEQVKKKKAEKKKKPEIKRSPLRFSNQTFEMVTFIEVAGLVRVVFSKLPCVDTSLQGFLRIRCIDFKVKHLNLLKSIDTWKALLYENSEKLPLLQNTKNFLRATLEHFIGDYDYFLLVQRSQVDRIVERIVSLFEPGCIRESYDELLDFGTSMKGIQPESIRDQNNFLFRYLIGWMGLFFHFSTEAAELRYLDPNSVKVHNPLMEKEETSNYLSRLVYNPTFGEIEKYERFGLLKMIYGGDTKRIAKSCVGSKVFKELDDETKQTLRKYFENFSAVAKRKITNELPRSSRQIGGLSKVFSSIVIEGISRDLFPEENIESCRKNIRSCLQYLNFYKPKKDTHIFETLDPCCDPVPVPFIERLNELGLSMDFQRAVFYNSMYFFKIFSLQVIRVYRNLIEEERCTHNEYKHKLAAKNIEFINNNVTTFQSTVDEEGSIVKNTTFQTPRKNHPNLISEREELILGKSNRRSMQSGINMQQEVAEGEDEISICSPVKKPSICVFLDSDSDVDS